MSARVVGGRLQKRRPSHITVMPTATYITCRCYRCGFADAIKHATEVEVEKFIAAHESCPVPQGEVR